MRGTDYDHVTYYQWRCIEADVAAIRIDFLIEVLLEIDHAVVAKRRHWFAGVGVERNHAIARRHIKNALVTAIGTLPPRQTTASALTRTSSAAFAFVFAVHPFHFTGGGIECHH